MPDFERPDVSKSGSEKKLSLQQNALAFGMLFDRGDAATNFREENGIRFHQNQQLQEKDLALLFEKFRSDPKKCLAYARENLLAISVDKKLGQKEREDRIRRYLDAYFDLVIKLDSAAFPPSVEIRSGIPEYIPNGLVDMGSDPTFDAPRRSREKIVVDKKNIYIQSRELFYDIFSRDLSRLNNNQLKNYFILRVAAHVHEKMPYNYGDGINGEHSVPLDRIYDKKLAKCRHHALYAQVLMQTLGLTSRLMKCDVRFGSNSGFGPHGANLVRNNYDWYLLDVTNPDRKKDPGDPKGIRMAHEVFLKKLDEKHIDLNSKKYAWDFRRNDGSTYSYRTRSNMYYYIKDTLKP